MKRRIAIAFSMVDKEKFFFLSTFAMLCGLCLFADGLPLNDAHYKSKWFGLFFAAFVLGIVQPFFNSREKNNAIRSADIIFAVLIAYVALRSLSRGSIEYGLHLTAIVALYVFFRRNFFKEFFLVIVVLTAVLSLWGIGQWFHLLPSRGGTFLVIGNFDNPAGYASALALGFPFIAYYWTTDRNSCRIASYIVTALVLLAIILSKSRAGMLAAALMLLWISMEKMRRIGKKGKSILLIVFLVVGSAGLYYLKKDSADGRMLIWLVTFQLIARHPLFGGGTGAFTAHYMPVQAHYFSLHPNSRFAMLADSISHPFNEYLSVVVQWGLVGLLMIGILLYVLLRAWRENRSKETCTLMMALLSLGLFAFFSYPLSYSFGWVILTLYIGFLGGKTRRIIEVRYFVLLKLFQTVFSVLLLVLSVWQYHAYTEWNKIIHHRPTVPMSDLQQRYEKLRPAMKRQPLFLYNYAAELHFHGCYSEALDVALQSRRLRDDYETEHLLADTYKGMKRNEDAKVAYKTMSQMCPNRFIPMYRLFEIAVEEEDYEKGKMYAKEIIEKPVKIPSYRIDFMKLKFKQFIINHNNIKEYEKD